MAQTIIMPKQGLQMEEGIITSWLVGEGQPVKEGQPLFEMETDKLTITIDSTATGTLLKILHPAGDAVPITQPIAYVGEQGEDISALTGAPTAPAPAAAPAESAPAQAESAPETTAKPRGRVFATPRARTRAEEKGLEIGRVAGSGPDGLIIERDVIAQTLTKATPLARKEAALAGADVAGILGSGSHGKVTAADVRAFVAPAPAAPPASAQAPAEARETVIPLKGMRKIIAQRMKMSLTEMAQANHRMEVDMTEAVRVREQLKAKDVKVSYNDIVIRCVAKALTEFPAMNASMTDTAIIQKHYVNVGMAVATEGGLLVPVIRDADKLTLPEISARAKDLGGRAKSNGLTPDDLTGGTFTITNLGMFGVDSFTAIINAPEAGILAVGQMKKKPVVLPDDTVAVRPMMWLSLTYDHRIVDGAPAAQFLGRVKALLEQPALLL